MPLLATGFSASTIVSNYKHAIVKLTVGGCDPEGKTKRSIGSGFIIYSGAHNTLIATAAHVIGSSEWRPKLNTDWRIEPDGRTLSRSIKVEFLNERGTLIELEKDASVVFQDDQRDVALLTVDRKGLSTVPIIANPSEVQGEIQSVALLGFPKDERSFDYQERSGRLRGLVFKINPPPIPEGVSGGPVIDMKTGKAFALASQNRFIVGGEHAAATLLPILQLYIPKKSSWLSRFATRIIILLLLLVSLLHNYSLGERLANVSAKVHLFSYGDGQEVSCKEANKPNGIVEHAIKYCGNKKADLTDLEPGGRGGGNCGYHSFAVACIDTGQ